ncbi:energy-coupling factor transport system ATP-binding protein [Propionicimonas paludicola]|uniref:Energy-coupling factor transport system ATP-binding protein n=1 Tax=Propionicimonas paludicola TaxID=185243 RepID=A0A2A9CU45_9ACTN|nr:ABC transporter ATP-binding protein [Propionicimonas paludicola]PFG17162.1 energy-coupling factor transport system ATP-binding protein [Propionicimonas paludicola]
MTSVRGAQIQAHNWGWRHSGRKAFAVAGLDLTIQPGERVLLLGASGAGKSTLIHALAGVLGGAEEGEQRGQLLVDGLAPVKQRGRIGLLQQDPDAQVVLSRVGDEVAFGLENLAVPRAEIWPRVRQALADVGLNLPLDHSTAALSGGQKQRLALACLLAMRPGLLLLDEPTANLDPDGILEVRTAVDSVLESTGSTLVVVEHRVEIWADLVDRVVVLDAGGGVLADGPTSSVLASQGARLAEAGVWVPGHHPSHRRSTVPEATTLLGTEGLATARVPGHLVAEQIDLELSRGELIAVTGDNGAGKSTLALTVGGLIPVEAGRVVAHPSLADGVGTDPFAWRSRELLTRIGTVFQEPDHQFLATTVADELRLGPRALGLPSSEVESRTDELLERLRLNRLAGANPFTLSGGEKRRLSVAAVLANRPKVLILDEPTFGQDAKTWRELVLLLDELLAAGRGILAVTHDRAFTTALADTELRLEAAFDGGVYTGAKAIEVAR